MGDQQKALIAAWSDHLRMWKGDSWVFPVISRRTCATKIRAALPVRVRIF